MRAVQGRTEQEAARGAALSYLPPAGGGRNGAVDNPSSPGAERFISRSLASVPASGIRKFFDLLSTIDDVISLGVGEPDYVTPEPIRRAALESIEKGETHYTSNYGLIELREALSEELQTLYGVTYDPATEIVVTSGSSEAFDIALRSLIDDGDEVLCPRPQLRRL